MNAEQQKQVAAIRAAYDSVGYEIPIEQVPDGVTSIPLLLTLLDASEARVKALETALTAVRNSPLLGVYAGHPIPNPNCVHIFSEETDRLIDAALKPEGSA